MNNKKNVLYFEGNSMRDLHDNIDEWQEKNQKRLLSLSIEKDGGKFCCVGLSNPSEVTIVDSNGKSCIEKSTSSLASNAFIRCNR